MKTQSSKLIRSLAVLGLAGWGVLNLTPVVDGARARSRVLRADPEGHRELADRLAALVRESAGPPPEGSSGSAPGF